MRSRFTFLLFPLVVALLFAALAACQNEGEGQPCDPAAGNSGNDDCQSPLVCTPELSNGTSPRCCPQDRANATTPECSESTSAAFDASAAPPDTSTGTPTAEAAAPGDGATESGDATGTEASVGLDASDGSASDAAAE